MTATLQATSSGLRGYQDEIVHAVLLHPPLALDAGPRRCEPFAWTKVPNEILDHANPRSVKKPHSHDTRV